MTELQVDNAIDVGYAVSHADMPRSLSRCEWAAGTYAFLAALSNVAPWWQAVVLRAAMKWIHDYRRRHACMP